MQIDFIHPPALMTKYGYSTLSHPPIGLAYIAAFLRDNGHSVRIIDSIGEGIARLELRRRYPGFIWQGLGPEEIMDRIDPASRVIGLSCTFSHNWLAVRDLLAMLKRRFPEALLIAGGEHVTALYTCCLQQSPLEICVLGEGEKTTLALVEALEAGQNWRQVPGIAFREEDTGRIKRTPRRARIADPDALPEPAWDLLPLDAYSFYAGAVSGKTMPMLGTRGCPYHCVFCSAPNMWQGVWRSRDPQNIAAEMARYCREKGTVSFQFMDISPFINRRWIQALCTAIIEKKLDISWQMPVGIRFETFDQTTARLLMQSGCSSIQFAPESGSPQVLRRMRKNIDLTHFDTCIDIARKAKMTVAVLFIIGFPGEKMRDVRLTYRLIRRLAVKGVQEISISSFFPMPGSALFADLQQNGAIETSDTFLLGVTETTHLWQSTSWNPEFSGRQILVLKWLGILQFYLISFFCRPDRLIRLLRNAATGRQESKVDRAVAEVLAKLKFLRSRPRK